MLPSIPGASCCLLEGGKRQLRCREQIEPVRGTHRTALSTGSPSSTYCPKQICPGLGFRPILPPNPSRQRALLVPRDVLGSYEGVRIHQFYPLDLGGAISSYSESSRGRFFRSV